MTPLSRQAATLAFAAMLLVLGRATAQDLTPEQVLRFSSDPEKIQGQITNINLRPNTSQNFFLFVVNPTDDDRTFVVQLSGHGAASLQTKATIAKGASARVRFAKPAAPAPVPVPVAVTPAAPPAKLPPPPPPGMELNTVDGRAMFTLRLLYEDGKPVLDSKKKPYERSVSVTILRPTTYIETPTILLTREETVRRLDVMVKTNEQFSGPPGYVTLSFPPQLALKLGDPGPGSYRREIDSGKQAVRLHADDVPLNPDAPLTDENREQVRFYIGVDGYERAYIFNPDFARATAAGKVPPVNTPDVRAVPVGANPLAVAYSAPVEKFPVRVEVDNPPSDARVELYIEGGTPPTDPEMAKLAEEVFRHESGVRDERIWLEPTGPDDGFFVSNRSSDWVKEVDARALRGRHEFVAVLRYKIDNKEVVKRSAPAPVIFDATGPDRIDITAGPRRLVKGKPLPVTAVIRDSETTPIVSAVFFLGRPDVTGKIPESALKVDGVQSPDDPNVWLAELPLPPDKRGLADLTVQATNQVGQQGTKIQRIELIDAAPPKDGKEGATTGAIEVTVELAGRPQAKVPVSVRDAGGGEKGAGITNEKGVLKIEGLQPGAYRVTAAKADSGVGTRGISLAQIDAGKTAKVSVSLSRLVPTLP